MSNKAQEKSQNAITPTRADDYPEWYQQVIKAADLSENSSVRGCMVIKPWGYGIWENMQRVLDAKFKETGHENAYFPLFIPLSLMEKEAQHVEGFAKECAVVTHHRLEAGPNNTLVPAGELDEPLIVRPTSEMIIGQAYAKWVQSYRDLPILINQWANVVRWEMRTRMFLRTTEFLWQEGHTVHATADEAVEETLKMLDVYEDFLKNYLAMPVIKGEKAPHERFPGADNTYTVEGMMQDRKALQAGTSHFLGQNFSKAMNIHFQNEKGEDVFAWTTSWGVSTRMVGGLIMTHSDDDGLVLPPKIAPKHVVIMPILGKTEEDKTRVTEYCKALAKEISAVQFNGEPVRVFIDAKDTGGGKAWGHIKKGVPVRIEVGPRDIAADTLFVGLRTNAPKDKKSISRPEFITTLSDTLEGMQNLLYDRALKYRDENTKKIDSLDELKQFFKGDDDKGTFGGFALVHWAEDEGTEKLLKEMKLTHRCIPLEGPEEDGKCIFTGKPSKKRSIIARSY